MKKMESKYGLEGQHLVMISLDTERELAPTAEFIFWRIAPSMIDRLVMPHCLLFM
tara:strand:- start:120 stop:284 length:165 start_codon:yes stop_codon:yes gene_type:complete